MLKFLKAFVAAALVAMPAYAAPLGLGRAASVDEISAWDNDVRPDGLGLPAGSGDVVTGEEIFVENCAACHGDFGEGVGRWPALAGGAGTLSDERPVKTIGSHWPYLSTVWDYINRAMTVGYGVDLSDDEIYAITAYLLYSNDLVDEDFVLGRENFNDISLPNEAGFYMDDRAAIELPVFTRAPCMEGCKPEVRVTMRAAADDGASEVVEISVALPDPELVAAGRKVFKKCKACHQIGEGASNKVGPLLTGVVGRAAGMVEGFKYSKTLAGMAADGLIWDKAALHAFLTKPRAFIPGTKMSFAGLKRENDRNALIAYLQSESL